MLPAVSVLLLASRRLWLGVGSAALVVALWAALTVVAFAQGYWLNIALPDLLKLIGRLDGARFTLELPINAASEE